MSGRMTSSETRDHGLKLDFTGLLGANYVFDAVGDRIKQAELIDANCNKMGAEGCCEPA